MRVPIKATPLSVATMSKVLLQAHSAVFDEKPTLAEMSWLLGLARHENANGKAIIQRNWGNRVLGKSSGDYWVPLWADESIKDSELSERNLNIRLRLQAGKPVPTKFAAYGSHLEGATKYLTLFRSQTHARVREAARRDDAREFHRAIYTPHPVTRMSYCPDCGSSAIAKQYQKLADDSRQYYDHLEEVHGPKKTLAGSSPLASAGLGGLAGLQTNAPNCRTGSWGSGVAVLQLMLGGLLVDGRFGPKTREKVLALQGILKQSQDGIMGPKTWDAFLKDQTR